MRPGRGAVALEIAAFAHYCLFGHAPGGMNRSVPWRNFKFF